MSRCFCTPLILFTLFFLVSCSQHPTRHALQVGESQITPELLQGHIAFLASDDLMGRKTPSPGLDSAAAYIKKRFVEMGLLPMYGSYYQDFSFCTKNLSDSCRFTMTKNGSVTNFALKTDYIPFELTGNTEARAEVVFAGYGITAEEYQYDDYHDLDVSGKIVVLLRHEPRENMTYANTFKGTEPTRYSNLNEKVATAKRHGAIGIVIITEPLNHNSVRPRGYPWPSLSKTLPQDSGPLSFCGEKLDGMPVVHGGEEVIKALFGSVDSLNFIHMKIDSTLIPQSFLIRNTVITLQTNLVQLEKYHSQNVVGLLDGSDPNLKEEVVVIGAHYDHVGVVKQHVADTDCIFNGADDNASGTSGVLAVAKAFSSLKERPSRSILFVLFAGEEKGLHGSMWYVNHPLIPLEKTVAMLNLDMISRNSPDTLFLIGAKQADELASLIKKKNKSVDLTLLPRRMSGGSDHWYFYKKNIPSIFFFTGLHDDYHQTSDNPEKTDPKKASRVARLVFLTALEISNNQKYYPIEQVDGDWEE
jgi:aminopeptidase YwaD